MSLFSKLLGLALETFPARLLTSLRYLRGRAVVRPSSVVRGKSIDLGSGVSVGANCRLTTTGNGAIRFEPNVWTSSNVEMETDGRIWVGSGTTIQRRSSVNGTVTIGEGCIVAPNVFISSGAHPFRRDPVLPIRAQEEIPIDSPTDTDNPVEVQQDVWLGVNSVVCPGVTVGRGAIVGANAVVTRNVRPYSVVAGAPARAISERLAWRPPTQLTLSVASDLAYVLRGVSAKSRDGDIEGVSCSNGSVLFALDSSIAHATLSIWSKGAAVITINDLRVHLVPGENCVHVSCPVSTTFDNVRIVAASVASIDTAGIIFQAVCAQDRSSG